MQVDAFTLEAIAAYTTSTTGQQMLAALDVERIDGSLCANRGLDAGIWDSLYLKYEDTKRSNLIANATTAEQARKILDEPVPYRRAAALKHGVAMMDEATKSAMIAYAQQSPETDCAAACITSGIASEEVARKFWERVLEDGWIIADAGPINFGDVLEGAVAKYSFISNERLMEMAEDGIFNGYLNLARIIDYRPSMVRPLLLSNLRRNFYNELASSRYLDESQAHRIYLGLLDQREVKQPGYGFEILGSNPCIKRSTRAGCLDVLVNERGASEYEERMELQKVKAALRVPPVQSDWRRASVRELEEVKQSLYNISISHYPTLESFLENLPSDPDALNYVDRSYVANVITPTLDRLGGSGWDLFISLAGQWSGGVAELLEVVRSTNR